MSRIFVVGSANVDLMLSVPTFPRPGETIRGKNFEIAPGGKGANHANGQLLSATLVKNGVTTEHLIAIKHAATGVALILTDQNGENCIALAGGANDELGADMINLAREDILNSSLLICQLEVPLGAVDRAMSIAKENNVLVLLNPAPAQPLPQALLRLVDFLVLNEHELASITGIKLRSDSDIVRAAAALLARGVVYVIVTLGARGALRANESGVTLMPARQVEAVDTTGAGDTFIGAFASALCRNFEVDDAIQFAQAAAAYSVTSRGAQTSMPYLSDISFKLAGPSVPDPS
jgi:ribokinase